MLLSFSVAGLLKATTMSTIRLTRGVLVTSDEPTIVFLTVLSEQQPQSSMFVIRKLDSHRLFVRADALPLIRDQLRQRLLATTFEGDDEEPE